MPKLTQNLHIKSALHKVKGRFPYDWDLNVYRGCGHGCQYCFAKYSHNYLNSESFFSDIFVKENIVEVLERELSSKNWKKELVNIGGVTDSYQPIEKELEIMPEILKLFIKYRTPITISTKSDLILRDIDLIDELSKITMVNIAATITTPDERIREKIEPGAVRSLERFRMLKEIKKTNATVGWHLMPIIPYLTDDQNDIETLFKIASQCEIDYVVTGKLYLRGKTRPHFLTFFRDGFPEEFSKLIKLYRRSDWDDSNENETKNYNHRLNRMLKHLKVKYHLTGVYKKPESRENIQLHLF